MGNQKLLIEGQTIQQSKENRQYNSQKKTDKRINNDGTKHYTEN